MYHIVYHDIKSGREERISNVRDYQSATMFAEPCMLQTLDMKM